jgi:hypothetical protein
MQLSFSSSFSFVALVAKTYASIYPTFPVGSSTIQAEKDTVIHWKNDEHAPNLEEFGKARIELFVGNDRVRRLADSMASMVTFWDRI